MANFDTYKGLLKYVKQAGPEITRKLILLCSKMPGGTKGVIASVLAMFGVAGVTGYKLGASNNRKEYIKPIGPDFKFEVNVFENNDIRNLIFINEIERVIVTKHEYEVIFKGIKYNKSGIKDYNFKIGLDGKYKLLVLNVNSGNEFDFDYEGLTNYIKKYDENNEELVKIKKIDFEW